MPIPKLGDVKYKVKRSSAGLGLFAVEPIKRGTWVIEYVGKILRGKEVAEYPVNKYLFETSAVRMIDGSARSNTARYINHSCKPNCEVEIFGGRVFVKVIKRIEVGEELTYDYGENYFDEYIKKPHCRCAPCKGNEGNRKNKRNK
ncbi:MAG: SET domain-containing protein [Candidatus Yonathbacteria bacterium]|nr:SET domain-containing protein [Candidatus Yonathbacteria bacterium]